MDPEGVSLRAMHKLKTKKYICSESNEIWHMTDLDKLKPLGFVIRGCIDGFNRKDLLALYCIIIDKLAIIQKKSYWSRGGRGHGNFFSIFPDPNLNEGKIKVTKRLDKSDKMKLL